MAGRNGTAPSVLTLDAIAYEREPYRFVINGETITGEGWVRGPGCPGRVKAEFARRYEQYLAALQGDRLSHESAYQEFLTDALRIVLDRPMSDYDALDLLAGDPERAESILVALKWRRADDEPEEPADPEAVSEDRPTTPGSSPTSVQPSAASAPTAAAG